MIHQLLSPRREREATPTSFSTASSSNNTEKRHILFITPEITNPKTIAPSTEALPLSLPGPKPTMRTINNILLKPYFQEHQCGKSGDSPVIESTDFALKSVLKSNATALPSPTAGNSSQIKNGIILTVEQKNCIAANHSRAMAIQASKTAKFPTGELGLVKAKALQKVTSVSLTKEHRFCIEENRKHAQFIHSKNRDVKTSLLLKQL